MSRAETIRKFDAIVDFAEVEKFIDTPVKRYSSGMYLRLAFSVAAHLEPEILLVDEVLAVGDLAFQRKCLMKMQDVGESGQTVIFVSHDMTSISRLAKTSIVLQDGQIAFWGPTQDAIHHYTTRQRTDGDSLAARRDRSGDGVVRIESIRFVNEDGDDVDAVGSGEAVNIVLDYRNRARTGRLADLTLDLRLTDVMGHPVTTVSTRFSPPEDGPLQEAGRLICRIPSMALAEEVYGIDLWLVYRGGLSDQINRAAELRVVASDYFGTGHEPVKRKHGPALVDHAWHSDADCSARAQAPLAATASLM
jgi:lipopolysaccharide transport system ATP-binding protein